MCVGCIQLQAFDEIFDVFKEKSRRIDLHSISFQNPAKNFKSGVDSRGETQVRGGNPPFPGFCMKPCIVNQPLQFL